ncbi:MAG: LTA synthase family protein [Chloroflexia bacterium]|nr:LTA synthase family protein [Chloroflexia bacterium]
MKNIIQEDLFFNNFLSSTRGTIFSLEDIIMDRYYPAISDTKERFLSHKSCVAYPYSQAGYETIFILGGKLSWRNLGEMLPKQYFSEVYGQSVIAKNIKETKMNTWGVYDEFLFEEIYRKLSEKSDKLKLIIALTTTNHTPYELPDDYKAYPINISDSINDIIISDHDIAQLNFRAYQYMNDQFGKFMDKIKSTDLAKNTIVGYSGDHNSYVLFPYESSEIEEINKHSVPFYLYVPDRLLKSDTVHTKRYSSHKDIFPTLINLSLSEQEYFCLGDNLLDNNMPDSIFYGINGYPFKISDARMPDSILNKKIKARKAISEYYFNNVRLEGQNKPISEN